MGRGVILSTVGVLSTMGESHEYREVFSTVADCICLSSEYRGGIMIHEGVQYHGGTPITKDFFPTVLTISPSVLKINPTVLKYPFTVVRHDIAHGTHDIPPRY